METITIQEAKRDLSKLIALAVVEQQQFRIASEEGAVIMLPEETYQNLVVTLELLSTPGLMPGFLKTFNKHPADCSSSDHHEE